MQLISNTIIKLITPVLIVLMSFEFVCAQDFKKFSGEPEKYIDELSDYMENNLTSEAEEILDRFIMAWQSDSLFSEKDKEVIIKLSQELIENNAKPSLHFKNYMNCLLAFKENNIPEKDFSEWSEGLSAIIKRKKVIISHINHLLENTWYILSENTLYKSASTQWTANPANYSIRFEKEIQFQFEKTELTCYAKRDSIKIFETRGVYFPLEDKWEGNGGMVTWERGGFKPEEVFATLDVYEIDMKKSEYQAEEVVFTNKLYFDAPLKGILIDKVKFNKTQESATYPQFDSYTKNFKIRNLYQDIDYEGGLSMQGAKLVGTGNFEKPAMLKIYYNDTLRLTANSNYFGFKSDRINGLNASIVIKLNKDSIYHPDLHLTYVVKNRELTLNRSENFTSTSPYFNSYHNVDMEFEQLQWYMNEPFMRFTPARGTSIGNANFESINFFNLNKYLGMQEMDAVHPLLSIRGFSKKIGRDQFLAQDFADYLKKPIHTVRQLLMRMSVLGFIFYDSNTDMATIKPRLNDYIAASVNLIDFDVINFPSRVEAPLENAVFDIRSNDLIIYGIPKIFVSDSQNVVIYPKREKIIMKRNRNFQFDGTVDAGLFTFYGSNFFFDYDSFKISLQNVDSMQIRFQTGKKTNYGFPEVAEAANLVQHITGEILIDKPDNKSGRNPNPEYPIFNSKENSYIFYNGNNVLGGVYNSDDFFFELYPFSMDSLDNFNAQSMTFEGEFQSAGILPVMEQTLKLQPDKSLGFSYTTQSEGIPVYDGKGIFKNSLDLSNKGLRGNGELDYLTSVTLSDDFIFYPDSMDTEAKKYTIKKQTVETQYPGVQSENNFIHWLPYADEMYAFKKTSNFIMFNDTTQLLGDLKLTPARLSGKGRMDLKNSDLNSDLFTYTSDEIYADTADFRLKSLNTEGFTVLAENMNSNINYTIKKGIFKSNEEYTLVNFPENRYISYLDKFIWDMEKQELAMGLETTLPPQTGIINFDDEQLDGPTFISMHPKQDSLQFVSPRAYYDYKKNVIKATGVKFIEVADARIYPDSGMVYVEEDANMRILENATVMANTQSRFHKFYSSKIKINSRNFYSGSGDYIYYDENDKEQIIYFKEIKVNDSLTTLANGEILEPDNFTLSPNYAYQGKVFLDANQEFLTFKGATLIETNCDMLDTRWLYFESVINPKEIYIPAPAQQYDINKQKIYNGMFVYYDSVHLYPAFLTPWKNYSDNSIVSADGFLVYDKASERYKISSKEKLLDQTLPGNYVSLHRESCGLYGEGKLYLGAELGQIKLSAVGNVTHKMAENETLLDMMLAIDFFITPEILNIIASEIDSLPDLAATDLSSMVYTKGMNEWLGPEKAQILKDQLGLFGFYKELPPELQHTLLFSELKFRWNNETNSYWSEGPIGIASINNTQINKRVNGLIELQIKRSGDILDIYLEADRRHWYYFGYTRGVMQTHASNKDYLDKIKELKPKDRRMKVPSGRTSYIYMISTDRKKDLFVRRFREGIEEQENPLNNGN